MRKAGWVIPVGIAVGAFSALRVEWNPETPEPPPASEEAPLDPDLFATDLSIDLPVLDDELALDPGEDGVLYDGEPAQTQAAEPTLTDPAPSTPPRSAPRSAPESPSRSAPSPERRQLARAAQPETARTPTEPRSPLPRPAGPVTRDPRTATFTGTDTADLTGDLGAGDSTGIKQGEWARCLVDVMGLAKGLPTDATIDDFIDLLNGRPKTRVPVAAKQFAASNAPPTCAPGASSEKLLGSQSLRQVETFPVDVPASGLYQLRAVGSGGATRWRIDGEEKVVLRSDGAARRVDSSRLSLLSRGRHRVQIDAPPGTAVECAELVPVETPSIQPPGGWNPEAELEAGERALTMVQAMGAEGDLPPAGGHQIVPARTLASGAAAGGVGAQARITQPGSYSVFVRGSGIQGSSWSIDDGVRRALTAASSAGLGWHPIGTVRLAAGTHAFQGNVPDGAKVQELRLVRRNEDGGAAMKLLSGLGFDLGPGSLRTWSAEAGVCEQIVPIAKLPQIRYVGGALAVAGFAWQGTVLVQEQLEEEEETTPRPTPPPDLSPM